MYLRFRKGQKLNTQKVAPSIVKSNLDTRFQSRCPGCHAPISYEHEKGRCVSKIISLEYYLTVQQLYIDTLHFNDACIVSQLTSPSPSPSPKSKVRGPNPKRERGIWTLGCLENLKSFKHEGGL